MSPPDGAPPAGSAPQAKRGKHLKHIAQSRFPQPFEAMAGDDDLWVLTRVIDDSDPLWEHRFTIHGSPQRIQSLFGLLQGISPGCWELLKGERAREFLRNSIRYEAEYQKQQRMKGRN